MNHVTLSVCPVSLSRQGDAGDVMGTSMASGFLWKESGLWFLITNWHNVAGKNPDTGADIGSFTPNLIAIGLKHIEGEGPSKMMTAKEYSFPLYEGDVPFWLEHPLRQKVDVVAIPINIPQPDSLYNRPLNEADFMPSYKPSIGADCFVIGYPKGLTGPGKTPIWKRASIATEPTLDVDNRPLVLIDTATRKGMSGSPVLAQHSGIYAPSGRIDDQMVIGTVQTFLGVYSGRVDDDELGIQIGRVWKSEVIKDILSSRLRGKHPLDIGRVDRPT